MGIWRMAVHATTDREQLQQDALTEFPFSDHVQTHPVVDRAARSAITTMAVRIKVMASSAMSLAV